MTLGILEDTLTHMLPEGYTARPAHMDDLPALVDMLNAYAIWLLGHAQFRLSDLRREWEFEAWNLQKYCRIVFAPSGEVVGGMEVWNLPPHVSPYIGGRVHPDHRGRGLSSALLRWAEAMVREDVGKAPDGAKVELHVGAEARDAEACAVMNSLGFTEARRFWRMEIALETAPPAPQWPEGITVRAVRDRDEEREAYRVLRASFKDHWGYIEEPFEEAFERWSLFTFTEDYDSSVRFLAIDGDQIAGISLNSSSAPENDQYGWIGQLGVIREYRSRGIAKALLLHSFNEFYRRGKQGVGLGVDAASLTGATKLYENVGMHVAREFVNFGKVLRQGVDLATRSVG